MKNSQKGFAILIPLLIAGAITLAAYIGAKIGADQAVQNAPAPTLGSTLPSSTPAVFETYLANQISSSDSSMVLASGSLRDGTSLSGYHCFTVDANTPSLEYMCGTASGSTISITLRGIDAVSGTSSVASLKFSHRRGADVKITDYPALTYLVRQLNGSDTIDTPIFYNASVATSTLASNRNSIASAGLVADTAFAGAGVINASTAAKGVVQIATQAQAAASTGAGSSGALVILPASTATSTYNSATAANRIPVTLGTGKIDSNFLDLSLYTGQASTTLLTASGDFHASSTSYLATTSIAFFNKLQKVFATTSAVAAVDINTTSEQDIFHTTLPYGILDNGAVLKTTTYVTGITLQGGCASTMTTELKLYLGGTMVNDFRIPQTSISGGIAQVKYTVVGLSTSVQKILLEAASSTALEITTGSTVMASTSSATINSAAPLDFKLTGKAIYGGLSDSNQCHYQPQWSYAEIIR